MNILKKRCPIGHFYDANRFENCPVCNQDLLGEISDGATETPYEEQPVTDVGGGTVTRFGDEDDEPEQEIIPEQGSVHQPVEPIPEQVPVNQPVHEPVGVDEHEKEPEVPKPLTPEPGIEKEIREIMSPISISPVKDDEATQAEWIDKNAGITPTVGWLACVFGEYFGETFEIKAGVNNIGRSLEMDIHLAQERTVSRHIHAKIIYDAENQEFFLLPGESKGITYLNKNIVLAPEKIKMYDKIKIGNAQFVFIPFCDNDLNWNTL